MRMFLALLLVVAACGKNTEPPPPSSGSPNAQTESGPRTPSQRPSADPADQARKMYATVCVMCHGAEGRGDGSGAAKLDPKPRDYTDAAWQASVTDDEIKKTILLGGQGVGKSPWMPGQPQLKDQPAVLDGLVQIIRGFKK